MARIDLSRHRFTQRPPTTLNLLPDKYFDLWLSIDTKNSPLCGILLRLRSVKWRWSKMKIFKRKKLEISNFGLQKCYIPQKKAENIYNKDSARKSKISCKKSIFFFDFSIFCLMLEDPRKFFTLNFPTLSKKNRVNKSYFLTTSKDQRSLKWLCHQVVVYLFLENLHYFFPYFVTESI